MFAHQCCFYYCPLDGTVPKLLLWPHLCRLPAKNTKHCQLELVHKECVRHIPQIQKGQFKLESQKNQYLYFHIRVHIATFKPSPRYCLFVIQDRTHSIFQNTVSMSPGIKKLHQVVVLLSDKFVLLSSRVNFVWQLGPLFSQNTRWTNYSDRVKGEAQMLFSVYI